MALYRSPLTVTLWPSSFLKKYGPMIPPAHKAHQTVSFSGFPCLIVEVKIGGVAIYSKEVQPVSQALATFICSLREFHRAKPVTCILLKAKDNDRRTFSPLPR
ncbi:hypothetical protein TNCV_2902151 [Trichonephila clavipes]|nr:hypothetical protein TNCV_2902151 [Trichonephila clavipes]